MGWGGAGQGLQGQGRVAGCPPGQRTPLGGDNLQNFPLLNTGLFYYYFLKFFFSSEFESWTRLPPHLFKANHQLP